MAADLGTLSVGLGVLAVADQSLDAAGPHETRLVQRRVQEALGRAHPHAQRERRAAVRLAEPAGRASVVRHCSALTRSTTAALSVGAMRDHLVSDTKRFPATRFVTQRAGGRLTSS